MLVDPIQCPFCGGDAAAHPVGEHGYWRTYCNAALTCGHSGSAMPTRQTSVEQWNRRADQPPTSMAEPPIYWRCFHCDFVARDRVTALDHFGPGISERPPTCVSVDALPPDNPTLAAWVIERWYSEVSNRPLGNKHRRSIDDVWRQVLRHLGVDPVAALGPAHDDLLLAAAGTVRES